MPGYPGGWDRLIPGTTLGWLPPPAARPPREGSRLAATVLVADDDADILRVIELNLRLEGFEVVTARDGLDALTKAVTVSPDLVPA